VEAVIAILRFGRIRPTKVLLPKTKMAAVAFNEFNND
jgi:hypothetical protein